MRNDPVPATEPFTLVDETNAHHGVVTFVSFAPVNRFGYRGCGVFSCSPAERRANIDAIKRGGVKVFAKRSGAAL